MRVNLKRIVVSSLLLVIIMSPARALAQAGDPQAVPPQPATAQGICAEEESPSFLGFPTWYKYLSAERVNGKCEITFDLVQDWSKILLAIFEIILRIGGVASVGFVIVGGFQYMLSQGEPERTKGAKSTILNAMIGLFITLSATAIVNLIGRNLT